ncbi:MAG TPA: glycosyltransferase family 39 protein [Acidobacteriaceae bacterium]|nr:glycosyltransferase family 39 protein [Acidobacteriaceae bacterium]
MSDELRQSEANPPVPRKASRNLLPDFLRYASLSGATEAAVLVLLTTFLLGFGFFPVLGGGPNGCVIGLVGADEPRYAQVAREMLEVIDKHCAPIKNEPSLWIVRRVKLTACEATHSVTPLLWGKPWLEKPALYYWRAMLAFKEFGVHDWAARFPSGSFAFVLIALTYLHMRRFRPGAHLDAALITASCVGIVSFARGASTDMQMAAPFCIAMLGWYAWYETGKKFWLFDLYFFGALATLAKGPVAPFMAFAIIFLFTALRREWSLLRRTIWIPGIALYLAMVLPWFIAVQHRNPQFLRQFFLEHNIERFATNRYQHTQPFWYYIMVLLLALLPWTVLALTALWDSIKIAMDEWRARRRSNRYLGHHRTGDAFPEFLVLWALFPVLFFSLSRSKLPGYILPAIPPITILTGDYLHRIRRRGLPPGLLIPHAFVTAIMTTGALLLPYRIVHPEAWPPAHILIGAIVVGLAAALLILVIVARFGITRLRFATLIPVVIILFSLLGDYTFIGQAAHLRNGHLLDLTYSARPMAHALAVVPNAPPVVAVYRVRRDMEYGLSFYRNQQVKNYDDGIPAEAHLLVVRRNAVNDLTEKLSGRSYELIFLYPAQDLSVFLVDAAE